MGRREVAGLLFAAVLTGGIAAVIGVTALPPHSPYFDVLRYFGFSACSVGFVGLAALLVFPGWLKSKEEQAIPSPLLEAQLTELREVEDFVARKSEGELRDTFALVETLNWNVRMIRVRMTGNPDPSVDQFFEGGQSRLNTSRVNMKKRVDDGAMSFELIPGRVGVLNVPVKYVESRRTLARFASSPRLPSDVIAGLKRLDDAIEENSLAMMDVLDEAVQADRNRILNYGKGGAPQYAWINNTYWHRFRNLKPLADDIGGAIRKYLRVA